MKSKKNADKNAKLRPILGRLMVILTVALLVLVGGFSVVIVTQQKARVDKYNHLIIEETIRDLTNLLTAQSRALVALEEILILDKNQIKALESLDRERLLAINKSIFTELSNKHQITHFYFHRPDRVNLIRVHKPEKYGDFIDRFTLREAERTKSSSTGIELGPLGTFTLRAVKPIFNGDTLIGYIELGKEIEDILAVIHQRPQIELAMSIYKNKLDRTNWESGMTMLGREANWARFPNEVLIYSSTPQFPSEGEKYIIEADQMMGHEDFAEEEINHRFWHIMVKPIKDVSGTRVGNLIIFSDTTDLNAEFHKLLAIVIVSGFILLVALFGFLYIILKQTDRGINRQGIELADNEEWYREFVEGTVDLITSVDRDGRLLYVNHTAEKIFGLKPEDCIGLSAFDFVHPDDRIRTQEWFSGQINHRMESATFENRQISNTGIIHHILWTVVFHYDDEDLPIRIDSIGRDITERRQAEMELVKTGYLLEEAQEIARLGYYAFDITAGIWTSSTILDTIFGINREYKRDVLAWVNIIHPDQQEEMSEYLQDNILTRHEEFDREYRIVNQTTGETRWVHGLGRLEFNDEGTPIRMIGTIQDITFRKLAEEALRESEERQRQIIENSNAGYFFINIDGLFQQVNSAWLSMHKYELAEEIIGQHFSLTQVEIDLSNAHTIVQQLLNDQGIILNEFSRLCKDGSVGYHTFSARAVRKEGEIIGVEGFLIDITDRRRAEEALEESEKKYRSMMESIKEPIYICSPDYQIEYMNPSMIKRIGRDATGENCFKAIHDLEEKCPWCEHYKIQGGEHYDQDIESPKDNHSYHLTHSPIYNEDGSISKMAIFTDTTKLKKLEAQFQQAQKMEALGTLAGGIAHNFNNVLTGILGRISLMMIDKNRSDSDVEHLESMEEYSQTAAELTKDLLGFARGGKYKPRPIDLNELIKHENRLFGRTKKEITLTGKYQENLWAVEADQGQIQQVLLNLYVNAWQAMPDGGNLYVQTENIRIDKDYDKSFEIAHGRYVKISVTDTGVGMDEITREKIFDPFYTTKEIGTGTGLGLASVYGIIKNHEGFIDVYSEVGEGTTFNIYLPASEKGIIQNEKKVSGQILKGEGTILLVDDEEMITDVGEQMLKRLGYRIIIANSGQEAINSYQKNMNDIDLVILDMIMPYMNGGETFNRLMGINPNIKVLLASGYSINHQAQEILDRGCSNFIQKPFSIREISQKIREVIVSDLPHRI